MGIIKVLDKQVAELIAAGEVVERPASIVKELVENSIDAGASKIAVEIKGGGIKYIRISDDGCGMLREDIPNAFIRHATSKVSTQDDLENIMTFGFRGEALASVAAMCMVELTTRTKDDIVGTKFIIEGSDNGEIYDVGCPVGTTIIIKNVFFNTPARLKFLKKDSYEGSNVASVLEKLAIINSNISFKLIKDGNVVLNTPGNNDLKASIHSVMGSDFCNNLIEVEYTDGIFNIVGYITQPTSSKPTRAMENFYINKRFVKSKTCIAAIEEAYKGSMMVGKFPGCVIDIKIPPNTVDVNVHPAKTEVRFSNENAVYNAVFNACKFALQKFSQQSVLRNNETQPKKNIINEFTLKNFDYSDKQKTFGKELYNKQSETRISPPKINSENKNLELHSTEKNYIFNDKEEKPHNEIVKSNKVQELLSKSFSSKSNINGNETMNIKESSSDIVEQEENNYTDSFPQNIAKNDDNKFRIIGEAFATYIIVEKNDTLILIDKHAAHERYLYNKLKNQATFESQILLEPIILNVDRNECTIILDYKDEFKKLGFDVDSLGDRTIVVREIPTILSRDNSNEAVLEIARKIQSAKDLTPEIIDNIYHSMACRAAVKANDFTGEIDMNFIVNFISDDENISYCPHGRPVMIELSKNKIERMFGRIV
ncbi:MAG: DNA mismatch repair endonuclease MutL [Oscillospiraceae bacterium]